MNFTPCYLKDEYVIRFLVFYLYETCQVLAFYFLVFLLYVWVQLFYLFTQLWNTPVVSSHVVKKPMYSNLISSWRSFFLNQNSGVHTLLFCHENIVYSYSMNAYLIISGLCNMYMHAAICTPNSLKVIQILCTCLSVHINSSCCEN